MSICRLILSLAALLATRERFCLWNCLGFEGIPVEEQILRILGFGRPISCFNLVVFVLLILTPWFPRPRLGAYVMVNLVLQISVHSCSAEAA